MALMYKYYKWSSLVTTCMTIADFIWWALLIDNGSFLPEKIAPLAVGYVIWAYASSFIQEANNFITETSQTGILEQIYLCPSPFYLKLISRFIAGMIYWTFENMLILGTIMLFCSITIPLKWAALFVFLCTLFGIIGFALIMAGMGLIFKKSQSFSYMMMNILLFLNGSILPLEKMPYWLQLISNTLPTTQGIYVIRNIIFHNYSLLQTIQDGSFVLLIFNSIIYFMAGWLIFSLCQKYAQNKGIIGHY